MTKNMKRAPRPSAPVIDDAKLVQAIGLDLIRESATNPRKTFRAIEELAENVREHGVLEPALVRPKIVDGGAGSGADQDVILEDGEMEWL